MNRCHPAVAVLAAFLSAMLVACGRSPSAPTAQGPPPIGEPPAFVLSTLALRGRVVDDLGKPVAGATVTVNPFSAADPSAPAHATTDGGGAFAFTATVRNDQVVGEASRHNRSRRLRERGDLDLREHRHDDHDVPDDDDSRWQHAPRANSGRRAVFVRLGIPSLPSSRGRACRRACRRRDTDDRRGGCRPCRRRATAAAIRLPAACHHSRRRRLHHRRARNGDLERITVDGLAGRSILADADAWVHRGPGGGADSDLHCEHRIGRLGLPGHAERRGVS